MTAKGQRKGETQTCELCGIEFYRAPSKLPHLHHYCSRKCSSEARSLPAEEKKARQAKYTREHAALRKEYTRTHREQTRATLKKYQVEHREERRARADVVWRTKKQTAVDVFGGCCQRCGYSDSLSALEFHHVDEDREGGVIPSVMLRSGHIEDVLGQLDGCALLCSNCHHSLHADDWEAKWVKREGWGWTLDD